MERAARLGWDAMALFGCAPKRPLDYLGSAGRIWAINGGRLLELHRDWAVDRQSRARLAAMPGLCAMTASAPDVIGACRHAQNEGDCLMGSKKRLPQMAGGSASALSLSRKRDRGAPGAGHRDRRG